MSSDGDLSPAPEPTEDPAPDRAPGGPADAFEPDTDSGAPATPDQPRSAQVEEHEVPDEIDSPEEVDEEEEHVEDEPPV